MTMPCLSHRLRRRALAGVAFVSLAMAGAPAHAQWTVFDSSNFSQNILTAARSLQQINNQITSLQNEAQMLINQARNLANLPYSSLQQLQQNVARTQQLLAQAQGIAYNVQNIDQAFATRYAPASTSASGQSLVQGAQQRWQQSVQALQDAMRTQATVVGNLPANSAQMSALVTSSQSATGALQATQAGNQLLALQAQQLADLTAAIAAQGRAQGLEAAQRGRAKPGTGAAPPLSDAGHGLPAHHRDDVPPMRGFGSRRLRAHAAWDAKAVRRALVLGGVGAGLIAVAVVIAGKEDEEGLRVRSSTLATAPAENPLAAEFARCNGLGNAAVDDAGCRAAWAENRRRFFGGHAHPAPER